MNDLAFVAILVAFFSLAVLFVRACEWLVGPDEDVVGQPDVEGVLEQAA